jgi:hypothetical protein
MSPIRNPRSVLAAALVAAAAAAVAPTLASQSATADAPSVTVRSNGGLTATALTDDGRLVRFDTDRPERAWKVGKVRGLQGDTFLVGIDVRVQDGRLYGVGDQGGVYTISRQSATATKVSQLTVALDGQSFGVDFNPAADRLRVVSDTGQNLRHDVNPGGVTVADGTLTTPPATTPTTGIVGAAYTNNDLDTNTATSLFDLDSMLDQVSLQAPANAGTLSPTGKVGADVSSDAGFDIYSKVRNGVTVRNTAFIVSTPGAKSSLQRVSLLTGDAWEIGQFPGRWTVVDLAVGLDR